jgi:hypothetical protein
VKRLVWSNLLLGLWLMISPFALVFANQRIFGVLWEDLILGFGIATFSLCRIVSRRRGEIVLADWLVMALGFLTLVNPFLYSYKMRRLPNGITWLWVAWSLSWLSIRIGRTKRRRHSGVLNLNKAGKDILAVRNYRHDIFLMTRQ